MTAPLIKPKLIAHEGDVTAGALKINDAYDLKLYEMPNGSFELILFMKIQFFFESGTGGVWTKNEQSNFTAIPGRTLFPINSRSYLTAALE